MGVDNFMACTPAVAVNLRGHIIAPRVAPSQSVTTADTIGAGRWDDNRRACLPAMCESVCNKRDRAKSKTPSND